MGIIGTIVKGAVGAITGYNERKREERRLDNELRVAAIKSDGEWARFMAWASLKSWKDEAWTVFCMGYLGYGFYVCGGDVVKFTHFLNSQPLFMQLILIASPSAAFGINLVKIYSQTLGGGLNHVQQILGSGSGDNRPAPEESRRADAGKPDADDAVRRGDVFRGVE